MSTDPTLDPRLPLGPYTGDAEVQALTRAFLDLSLPKPGWTHAAHFAVACTLLRTASFDAVAQMPALIRRYNEATATPNTDSGGYHETITLASLKAARAWLAAHPECALHTAINGLLASGLGRSDWMLRYWSRECLFSVAARRAWVAPDLQDLPF